MISSSKPFGTEFELFEYKSDDMFVQLTNWGARVVALMVKDKNGEMTDVVAGFDTPQEWLDHTKIDDPYFNAVCGRVAGRICPCENVKIADGVIANLPEIQPNKVCLHGGKVGFDKKKWEVKTFSDLPIWTFTYTSEDGEEGFPGRLEMSVTYSVEKCDLKIRQTAKLLQGKATIVNPTVHLYFNLDNKSTVEQLSIKHHFLKLNLNTYMVGTDEMPHVVTGELSKVTKDDPLNFYDEAKTLGEDLKKFGPQLRGYDHIFVRSEEDNDSEKLEHVCSLWSLTSGIKLDVLTNQPALVVYTGNWISDRLIGTKGKQFGNYSFVALETMKYSNAIHNPNEKIRNQVLLTSENGVQESTTIYSFSLN